MKKNESVPLLIVTSDDEMMKYRTDLDTQSKNFEDRLKFLEKQRDTAWEETLGGVWSNIRDRLKVLGILPKEYNEDKHGVRIENGVLMMYHKTDDGGGSFFDGFMGFFKR